MLWMLGAEVQTTVRFDSCKVRESVALTRETPFVAV